MKKYKNMARLTKDFLPYMAMLLSEIIFAGLMITSKLAMDFGMNPFVLVAYRQIFATLTLAPLSYSMERKNKPKMTCSIVLGIFMCATFGATATQLLYFLGLKFSTPIVTCALNNLLPAITFILAVPFGLEKLGLKKRWGQAKVIGTAICVSGAMIISFYHGFSVGQSNLHWKLPQTSNNGNAYKRHVSLLGPVLIVIACFTWAIWFIIQAKVGKVFPAPFTTMNLMSFIASIQCSIIVIIVEPRISVWALNTKIRLVASLYSGVLASGIAYSLIIWCIQMKGPLFATIFIPFRLIVVSIFSWALLGEILFFGKIVGSVCIVIGLYVVLWGKHKEVLEVKMLEGGGRSMGGANENASS